MTDTAAIDEFLRNTLRAVRAGESAPWPASFSDEEATDRVWLRIEVHGLDTLLHKDAKLLESWPQDLTASIAEEARLLALWEMTHSAALAKLVAALDKAGIESVLMKGTALAYSLHADPAARRRGDSDLLIRPEDLAKTRKVLMENGWYRGNDPHGLTHQEGWLIKAAEHFIHALDLHWLPSDRPVIQRVLTADEFFAHKQPLDRLAPAAFRADYALTMIHETINQKWHCVHGYWTDEGRIVGARRLIWSVDFDLMARAMEPHDWSRLTTLCAARGVGPLVAEAIRGAKNDLGTPLPDGTLAELEAMPLDPDVAAYFAVTDKFGEFWLDVRTANSWGERGRMLASRAFPPRSHLVKKYPGRTHWPTFALQGAAIAGNLGRILKRVVAR